MTSPGSGPGAPGAREKTTAKAILISIVAAVGGFLFGFDTSVINGAVSALSDEFSLGAGLTGFAVSSALIGCAVGAWFAGGLANRFGRVGARIHPFGHAAFEADIDTLIETITASGSDAIAIAEGGAVVGVVTTRNLLLGVRGEPDVRAAAAWVGAHAPGEPVSEDVLP